MNYYPNLGNIVLASASPRRRELLSTLGLTFDVEVPQIDEAPLPNEAARPFVERMAKEKADAAMADPQSVVIAADTIVVLDGTILGKPTHEAQAFEMLTGLSGKSHEVITGVCVRRNSQRQLFSVVTKVFFRTLEAEEIRAYIASGCPMDKAGAYAIQGGAAHMVRTIEGSYTNVVGLPLCELHEALISF